MNTQVVSHTTTAPATMASTILELLPTELFPSIAHNLDSYSMRDLLRALRSLSGQAIIVLGPGCASGSSPSFFTGFASAIFEYSSHQEDQLVLKRFPIKLYEVNTRVSLLLTDFINSELKHLKGMSFIHLKGNLNPLGDTRVMKTLNSMHTPYAPRISFEYCARKSKFNVQKKYICFPSVLNTDYFSQKYTNISIDSRYLTEIGDIKFKHIRQLEIRFYKSKSIPVIRDLDLPNVTVFSIKYYRKIPLMMNIKIGHGKHTNTTDNKIFELFDTSGFDVHYCCHYTLSTGLSDYEGRMDLSFTENFEKLFIVGGSMVMLFTMFNLKNATSFFWYDTVFHDNHWTDSPKRSREDLWLNTVYEGAPNVKCFTYFTSFPYGCFPMKMKLNGGLEVVRFYSNASNLQMNGIIDHTYTEGSDDPFQRKSYINKLKIVDICCDLPLQKVGGDDHIFIGAYNLRHIFYAPKMRYLNISGCYLGEDNELLFKEFDGFYSTEHLLFKRPYKKELKLELVRKIESEVDQGDVLALNILSALRNYLSSLTITQARGDRGYKQWKGLSTSWPDHLLSNGLQIHIDPTLGNPTVTIRLTSAWPPYTLTFQPISQPGRILDSENSFNHWTTMFMGRGEGDEWPWVTYWKMVPTESIDND